MFFEIKQICSTPGTLRHADIHTYTFICVFVQVCVYIFAASDDAYDFPAFEKRGKQTARSLSLILCFTICTLRKNFAKYNGKTENSLFKENSLRDETHNLTNALLRSIQKVKDLILT